MPALVNFAEDACVYAAMPGMLIFAFFATMLILRATRAPGAGLTSGIVLMGFGVWIIWAGAIRHHEAVDAFDSMPRIAPLLFGTWLVVKGALRFSA